MMPIVVRARQKPFEDLPEWWLCCDKKREAFRAIECVEVDALPGTLCEMEVTCRYCGRKVRAKFMDGANWSMPVKGECFAVECFEFDEGVLDV